MIKLKVALPTFVSGKTVLSDIKVCTGPCDHNYVPPPFLETRTYHSPQIPKKRCVLAANTFLSQTAPGLCALAAQSGCTWTTTGVRTSPEVASPIWNISLAPWMETRLMKMAMSWCWMVLLWSPAPPSIQRQIGVPPMHRLCDVGIQFTKGPSGRPLLVVSQLDDGLQPERDMTRLSSLVFTSITEPS